MYSLVVCSATVSAVLKGNFSDETRKRPSLAISYARSVADCRCSDATLEICINNITASDSITPLTPFSHWHLSRQQVREVLEAVRLQVRQHKQHACWSTK